MVGEFVRVDAADPSALSDALDVVRAAETRTHGRPESTAATLAAQLSSPDAVPGEIWLTVGEAGAGLVVAERYPGSDAVFLDVRAGGHHPAAVAESLLRHSSARALSLPDVRRLESSSPGDDGAMRAALTACGFVEVRRYWRMRRDLGDVGPDYPPAPNGVTLRVVAGEPDRRALHRLRERAFFGSDGFESRTLADYLAILDGTQGADPQARWLAECAGEPVALCISDDSRAGQGDAYLRTVGVLPEFRGRGIARWLLGCAAAYAVGRGRSGIVLTVDGRNSTGATDLYRSAGYEVTEVIDAWERAVGKARDSADSR